MITYKCSTENVKKSIETFCQIRIYVKIKKGKKKQSIFCYNKFKIMVDGRTFV